MGLSVSPVDSVKSPGPVAAVAAISDRTASTQPAPYRPGAGEFLAHQHVLAHNVAPTFPSSHYPLSMAPAKTQAGSPGAYPACHATFPSSSGNDNQAVENHDADQAHVSRTESSIQAAMAGLIKIPPGGGLIPAAINDTSFRDYAESGTFDRLSPTAPMSPPQASAAYPRSSKPH